MKSPFDLKPQTVDEQAFITLLEILIASGKISKLDVDKAWDLFYNY